MLGEIRHGAQPVVVARGVASTKQSWIRPGAPYFSMFRPEMRPAQAGTIN